MTYTTIQAVLVVFRRRLTFREAIAFAAVLPAVLRAIFVADWELSAERLTFGTVDTMNDEVKLLCRNHNFHLIIPFSGSPRSCNATMTMIG